MKCLYKECPMFGKEDCPAALKCPEYRRCVNLKINKQVPFVELSPIEAIKIYTLLGKLLSHIDDFGNPPDYWPSKKDDITEEKTYRYYLYKSTGEIYKHYIEMDNCYKWNTEKKEWQEESFDFVMELEFCKHVEVLK